MAGVRQTGGLARLGLGGIWSPLPEVVGVTRVNHVNLGFLEPPCELDPGNFPWQLLTTNSHMVACQGCSSENQRHDILSNKIPGSD